MTPLEELKILPGLYTLDTDRGSVARWKDGDHVRFYKGYPEKIGGYAAASLTTFSGKCRGLVDWASLSSVVYVGVGTHLRLYIWDLSAFYNITPLRASGTLGNNPFTTTASSAIVTVTHTNHGLAVGDYVIFDGASAVGGITVDGEYTVTAVNTADEYTVTHGSAASGNATGGGASVTYEYELPIGLADNTEGLGWGAGAWGDGTWGTPRATSDFDLQARIWSLALWGEDMIACPRDGSIYVWDASAGTSTRATRITQAPLTAKFVFVTEQNRTIVALGAYDGTNNDPMLVRWCDEENYTEWTAGEDNTAGEKRLDKGNELMCAVETRRETLIFSDSFLWSMTFIGPPYTYGFDEIGRNGGLMGPNAAVEADGKVYWMGANEFKVYDGVLRTLPCDVLNHVFDSINRDQAAKVFCWYNRKFGEVWWEYPTGAATENDAYVAFNVSEGTWHYGTRSAAADVRTAFIGDSDVRTLPYGAGNNGYLYDHETTVNADGSALSYYLESADAEIGNGDYMMLLTRLVPDFKRMSGSMTLTCKARRYPNDSEQISESTGTMTSSTKFMNPRIKGRQVALRFSGTAVGDDFRMGKVRVGVKAYGKK